jgi:hypothetical protein
MGQTPTFAPDPSPAPLMRPDAPPSGLSVRQVYHGWILRLTSEYFQRNGLADFAYSRM